MLPLAGALAGEPNFATRTFSLPSQTHALQVFDLNQDGARDSLAAQNCGMKR